MVRLWRSVAVSTAMAMFALATIADAQTTRVSVATDGSQLDDDGDTMTNAWEVFFGLNPASAADASQDLDFDGLTNAQEHAVGTHPKALSGETSYFAEGAATSFFDTRIAVANPSPVDTAAVLL